MDINLHIPQIYIIWVLVYLCCGLLTVLFMKTKDTVYFFEGVWAIVIWPFIVLFVIIAAIASS